MPAGAIEIPDEHAPIARGGEGVVGGCELRNFRPVVIDLLRCICDFECERVSVRNGGVVAGQESGRAAHHFPKLQAVTTGGVVGEDLEVVEVVVVHPAAEQPDWFRSGIGGDKGRGGRQGEADRLVGAGRGRTRRIRLTRAVLGGVPISPLEIVAGRIDGCFARC